MATNTNLQGFQKTDFTVETTNQDSSGTALNIDRAFFTVRKRKTAGGTPIIELNSHDKAGTPQTDQIEITDAANGLATVKITDALMDIDAGAYYWDLKVRTSSGNFVITYEGTFTVLPAVTQREEQAT